MFSEYKPSAQAVVQQFHHLRKTPRTQRLLLFGVGPGGHLLFALWLCASWGGLGQLVSVTNFRVSRAHPHGSRCQTVVLFHS